jgi:hypothetical protein
LKLETIFKFYTSCESGVENGARGIVGGDVKSLLMKIGAVSKVF